MTPAEIEFLKKRITRLEAQNQALIMHLGQTLDLLCAAFQPWQQSERERCSRVLSAVRTLKPPIPPEV